jgi:hypothetical protein
LLHMEKAPMVDKTCIVNMWRLLGAFDPESGAGSENLHTLKDLMLDIIGLDATDQVRVSREEMLAISFIYDMLKSVLIQLDGGTPLLDCELSRQAEEQGLVEKEEGLKAGEAESLAKRDGFLFRVWALSQVEQVIEYLGDEKPGKQRG